MRNELSDNSVRDTDHGSYEDPSHKSRSRMYAEKYRENAEASQAASETRVIPVREIERESRESFLEETSRDFSSPEVPKADTSKLTNKEGPRLTQKEVNLQSESLQRGDLKTETKPLKKEVDLKKARKKAIKKEQYKRLHFDDEPIMAATGYTSSAIHRKVSESSDDNASVEAFDEGTRLTEEGARKVSSLRFESHKEERNRARDNSRSESSSGRLKFDDEEPEVISEKPSRRKEQQKRAIKKQYAAKKRDGDTGSILTKKRSTATKDGGLGARLKEKVQNFVEDHKGAIAIA
ncbi:MAG: hypothetical protein J6O00_09950, partial [Clostridiales bacterium]|nr:hypothetical protein [Clostridiales bacterium]